MEVEAVAVARAPGGGFVGHIGLILTGLTAPAGTALAIAYARLREPMRSARIAEAGIAAVDGGRHRRFLCSVRGTYGAFQGRYHGGFIDLGPDGPVLLRYMLFVVRSRVPITEELLTAQVRPLESQEEVRRFAAALYAAGSPLAAFGRVIVSCQTPLGLLDFAIRRQDVPVFLHYVELMRRFRGLACG